MFLTAGASSSLRQSMSRILPGAFINTPVHMLTASYVYIAWLLDFTNNKIIAWLCIQCLNPEKSHVLMFGPPQHDGKLMLISICAAVSRCWVTVAALWTRGVCLWRSVATEPQNTTAAGAFCWCSFIMVCLISIHGCWTHPGKTLRTVPYPL